MNLADELKPYRGSFVEGVGGFKVEKPLPRVLSWRARRADLVRRIRHIWYIRGDGEWKLQADRIGLRERLFGRFRGSRPQTDSESRRYWEERGGEGYEQEAFSAEWFEAARRTLRPVWDRLSSDGVRSLLEVGCGPGRNLTLLREMGVPSLLGLDFSFPQLERARSRGFPIGQATAKILPVRSKSVDAILFAKVLIHVPPPIDPVIAEAVRVSRRYVVLLEDEGGGDSLESVPSSTPHCFRHNLLGHLRKRVPEGRGVPTSEPAPDVHLFRLS